MSSIVGNQKCSRAVIVVRLLATDLVHISRNLVAAGPVILNADGEFGLPTRALAGKYGAFLTYDAPPAGTHSSKSAKRATIGASRRNPEPEIQRRQLLRHRSLLWDRRCECLGLIRATTVQAERSPGFICPATFWHQLMCCLRGHPGDWCLVAAGGDPCPAHKL